MWLCDCTAFLLVLFQLSGGQDSFENLWAVRYVTQSLLCYIRVALHYRKQAVIGRAGVWQANQTIEDTGMLFVGLASCNSQKQALGCKLVMQAWICFCAFHGQFAKGKKGTVGINQVFLWNRINKTVIDYYEKDIYCIEKHL